MYPHQSQFFTQNKATVHKQVELPPIMHFIWVGPSIMPNDGIRLVSEWAQANPNFQMWIWIDFKQFSTLKSHFSKVEVEKFILEQYQKAFGISGAQVFLSNIDQKLKFTAAPIILKDIWSDSIASENEGYEMYQLNPSWGLPSDSLRLKILYKYGGAYADCRDIRKGPTSLEESQIFISGHIHKLYIDHKPQEVEISEEELANFDLDLINNDFLICTKNNPAVGQFAQGIENKYNFNQETTIENIFERAFGSLHKFYLTLSTTGGTHISNELSAMNLVEIKKDERIVKYITFVNNEKIEIHPVRCLQYCLYNPEENKLSWLYTPVVKFIEKDAALEMLERVINFEIKRFKIFKT